MTYTEKLKTYVTKVKSLSGSSLAPALTTKDQLLMKVNGVKKVPKELLEFYKTVGVPSKKISDADQGTIILATTVEAYIRKDYQIWIRETLGEDEVWSEKLIDQVAKKAKGFILYQHDDRESEFTAYNENTGKVYQINLNDVPHGPLKPILVDENMASAMEDHIDFMLEMIEPSPRSIKHSIFNRRKR